MEITSGIIGLYGYGEMWLNALEMNQIVRPLLHHLPSLGQVLGKIVRGPDGIPFTMSKLLFNPVPIVALFIQQR